MTSRRWNKAQEAEKKYWRSTKESWLSDNRRLDNRRLYWQEILHHGFIIIIYINTSWKIAQEAEKY